MQIYSGFCPIRSVLDRIGDKWSVLILLSLAESEVMRFSELSRAIPDVSQKMLTSTLRTLDGMKLVTRKVYPEVPPRVEYRLTDTGRSLIPHLNALVNWALEKRETVMAGA